MNNSMINPSIMDLLKKVDDRYSLVIITSKRARQIIDGSKPYIDTKLKKALTISINEVNEGKIDYYILNNKDKKEVIESNEQ
ncbi:MULTISPECIES: DNA-directed RNA polymerase subunit omega [Eubacteriales]|uniref:DNA-directed RNA polymerase subunit omega n=1 Tax=Clostridium isatidis TaxID=182773 RepID=A0A343JBR6_9CLOT|nr:MULTISPECIES: DNA-directed RNA polymerase subunit omega [Eubacteriales]ASW42974.1 DNA-directed RNA polymerase subunit omega [Clostridium isatidis]MBU5454014.1 DNA-directed RNA polymerase subunit omega [Caproiciproducens sp. MSJ-32]NLZ35127.1 DNA-directed RNA polymerase subunit omega [Clostridiales bacterium]